MARYINPVPLYNLAKGLKQPLVGFDWGKAGVGICIVDFSQSMPTSYPIPLVDSNPDVNYASTPLEFALRDFRRALIPKREMPVAERFDYKSLIPLQVLRPRKMSVSDMSEIVKDVGKLYGAVGYTFGYSADSRYWGKEEYRDLSNRVYFENFFNDLDANGGLPLKLFTILNEKNSSKHAKHALRNFPLASVDKFLSSHRMLGHNDTFSLQRALHKYGISHPSILQKELDDLKKSYLDCFSAVNCTRGYTSKVEENTLYQTSGSRKEMNFLSDPSRKMGYPAQDHSFLVRGVGEMECFTSHA